MNDVLQHAAAENTPLLIYDMRALNENEAPPPSLQREQVRMVFVKGDLPLRIKFVSRIDSLDKAKAQNNAPVSVTETDAGYRLTHNAVLIAFIPKAKLLKLTGHDAVKSE